MAMKHWFKQAAAQSNSQRTARARAIRQRQRDLTERLLRLECLEARLVLDSDFGDAPDLAIGVGTGNYNTLASDNGPSHTIVAGIKLGANVDGEADASPSAAANNDDKFISPAKDDEDGLIEPGQDLILTVGTAPQVRVRATNTTGADATLYGWIDINRNGAFDNATERASVVVAAGTTNGTFTLTFPTIPLSTSAGQTYARFRLSTDAAATDATGAVADGEVEDYVAHISRTSTGVSTQEKLTRTPVSPGVIGRSVASLGDLDGDGVTDLAIGDPVDYTGGAYESIRGAVQVVFMNANGTVKSAVKIASNTNGGPALADFNAFGNSVASLGDLNGDGVTDLAVGARGDANGAMHVLFLNADGTVKASVKIASGLNGGPILANGDDFGKSLASMGDLDGDGITDLAVGATGDDTGGPISNVSRGAVHILFLNSNGTVKNSQKIASGLNGGPTLATYDYFGSAVASIGDLDGDGVTDLAVGAFGDSTGGGFGRGAVHVLFLNANGTVKNSQTIAHNTNGGPALVNDDRFGWSVASLGDLDSDGVTDLAVGAAGDDTRGYGRGAVRVLFLNANGTVKDSLKIANDTNGGPTLTEFGYFGSSATALGDVDGDGVTDLMVGEPGVYSSASNHGAVHVLFLNANGTVKNSVKIEPTSIGGPYPDHRDSFGSAVASLGDLDGDGVTDLAVGASRDDTGGGFGSYRGAVHVLFMNANGTVKDSLKIANNTNGGPTLADFDRFGHSVASLGDLDGDGVTDLAVGAYRDPTGGYSRGAVYVLFLNGNGTVKSSLKIASNTNGGPTLADDDSFGSSVASLGDLDGDGVIDLAVGARDDDADGSGPSSNRGAVHVLFMNANGTVKNSLRIASTINGGPPVADTNYFGSSVASLGDLDGDGITDLAVGAYGDDTGGTNRGAVHVLFLNANGTVKSSRKIASATNGAPTLANGEFFGRSVASLGDLDGDGVTDLAVGAFFDATGGTRRGAVRVLFLNANGTVKNSLKIANNTNGGPTLSNSDFFGTSVTSLGDLDGDGVTDLAVGAYKDDTVDSDGGAVHILFLKPAVLLGDVNHDGVVNIFDINLVSSHWGETGPLGDANDDHIVNIFDINLISANWSPSPGGGSGLTAGADEPGSTESGSTESGSAESPLRMPTADLVEVTTSGPLKSIPQSQTRPWNPTARSSAMLGFAPKSRIH